MTWNDYGKPRPMPPEWRIALGVWWRRHRFWVWLAIYVVVFLVWPLLERPEVPPFMLLGE